jgi:hypothetical protein
MYRVWWLLYAVIPAAANGRSGCRGELQPPPLHSHPSFATWHAFSIGNNILMKSDNLRSFFSLLQWCQLSPSKCGEGNDICKVSNPAALTICNYWGTQMAGEPTHRCVGFMLGRALGVIFTCIHALYSYHQRMDGWKEPTGGPRATSHMH